MGLKNVLKVSPKWRCLPFSERDMFRTYSTELHRLSNGENMKFYVDYGLAGTDDKPCLMAYEILNIADKGEPIYNAVYVVSGMREFDLENGSYEKILMLAKSEGVCLWKREVEQPTSASTSASASTYSEKLSRKLINPLTYLNTGSFQSAIIENVGSSAESVGLFWLREFAKCVV